MKKFIKTAFCITLLFSSLGKISAKNNSNYKNCSNNSGCSDSVDLTVGECSYNNSCSNSCDSFEKYYSCSNSYNNSCEHSCNDSCESIGNCSLCCATPVRTIMHFRSQGANTARELVGWQWELNLPFMCSNYGSAYFVYEYQRSFNDKIIANAILGGSTLHFAGSLVPDRKRHDLLAENFGLSSTFKGSIFFKPRIQNHIFDFGYYMGLDQWVQGLYVRFQAPLVLTYWSLRPKQTIEKIGDEYFSTCFVGGNSKKVKTASGIIEALRGNFLFGEMQTPWCAGKFDPNTRERFGLADIDVILGYNFLNTDCYHLGLYGQMVMPSGPKYKDKYIFDPVVGNYGFFEAGAGISAHIVLFSENNHNLALFIEGNITHMCRTQQCRLFDFYHAGAFSRYAILKQYDFYNQYTGNLINATCFANRYVDVSVGVKGDVSAKMAYRNCGWGIDFGYNLYGHSSESVRLRQDANSCLDKLFKYAIKGTSPVCCFDYPIICVPTVNGDYNQVILPNNSTVPAGTLQCQLRPDGIGSCQSTNPPFVGTYTSTITPNNGAQPAATAFAPSPIPVSASSLGCDVCINKPITEQVMVSSLNTDGYIIINNSTPTKFLTSGDLNIISGESIGVLTHKIFAHFNYAWFDKRGINPQVGVGGEVEFNDKHINDLNCKNAGLSQWGVWLKANISF